MDALSAFQSEFVWALVVGFVIAFALAFAIGANDTANSFGTSVGSGVLTLYRAYALASVFESLGAALLGYVVVDTMRRGAIDLSLYEGSEAELLMGQIAILGGCALWLLIATYFNAPVSTSHSIVGATIGFSWTFRGFAGVRWSAITNIFLSWILSPVLAGVCAALLYLTIEHLILQRKNSFTAGVTLLPLLYFFVIFFNVFAVLYQGSAYLGFDQLSLTQTLLITLVLALIVATFVRLVWIKMLKSQIRKELRGNGRLDSVDVPNGKQLLRVEADSTTMATLTETSSPAHTPTANGTAVPATAASEPLSRWKRFVGCGRSPDAATSRLFGLLQATVACFAAFAHGGNDVANAISPLVSIYALYQSGSATQSDVTPIWLLLYGAVGMCIGLWTLGHRVIYTVGTDITVINAPKGFCIEFGTAIVVLLASKLGLPISSTQCKIGAVVAVGALQDVHSIRWSVLSNVLLTWVVTLPASALLSAGFAYLLRLAI